MVDLPRRTIPASNNTRRNFYMCQRCRADKKKCAPQDYDWNKERGKCQRCARLGHECFFPVRAQGAITKKRSTMELSVKGQNWSPLHGDIHTLEEVKSTSESKPIYEDSEYESDFWLSLCSSPVEVNGFKGGLDAPPKAIQLMRIVAKLGDQNALQDLLRRDLLYCDRVERWLGETLAVKSAINAIVCAVQKDFRHEVREARNLASNDLGISGELILSELLCVIYRFSHPPTTGEQPVVSIDQKIIQQMLHLLRKERGLYSEADWILGSACGMARAENDSFLVTESYIKASQAIASVLKGLAPYDIEHSVLLQSSAYPASHLAYIHGDESAAFTLWSTCHEDDPSIDMFGRTLVHLAVCKSDDQMLRRLLSHDRNVASRVDHDNFGMTPLQIAACQDDISCFSLMWTYGANNLVQDCKGRSVLALAARSGSQRVVASILQAGRCPPSLVFELHEAIEAGHEHIARMIIAHYSENMSSNDRSVQLDAARIAAENAGFEEIARQISNLKAPPPSCQAAITCLDNFDWNSTDFGEPGRSPSDNMFGVISGSKGPTLVENYDLCPQEISLSFADFNAAGFVYDWIPNDSNTGLCMDC